MVICQFNYLRPVQLPEAFVKSVEKVLGVESAACISAIDNDAITSIRLNQRKPTDLFSNDEKIDWADKGIYLKERPSFIADPSFHAGAYYVQESSSMFTAHAFKQIKKTLNQPIHVLDLCAAPGGKSTLLIDEMSDDDLLVSNEIIKTRVAILEENLVKWGRSNVLVTNNDPAQIGKLENYFDVVVIDAPCSGEGMFRKDKKAIEEWSESHTEFCASRQKRILSDALSSLKPGGFLIYSTCTFNTKENEENVKWLIDEFNYSSIKIEIENDWGIEAVDTFENTSLHAYRFYPHKVKGEGFFLACLQKPSESFDEVEPKEVKTPRLKENELALLSPWIDDVENYHFVFNQAEVMAYPKTLLNDIEFLKSKFTY